jgi:hypothetical protein
MLITRRSVTFALGVLIAVCAQNAKATSVLTNGDFQTGDLTSWAPFVTANGSNGPSLPNVVSFNTTGSGASLAAHFNVGEVNLTHLPEGGGLSQTFILGTPGVYSFFANIGSQDDANGININGDAGTYSILIDGTTLASDFLGSFNTVNQIILGTLSGSVSLSAGPHTFEVLITRDFTGGTSGSPDEYVDNISLSAVPEPRTFALVALAIFGLAFYRQKLAAAK